MCLKKLIGKGCDRLAGVPLIGPIIKPKQKIAALRLSGVITDSPMRRQTISYTKFEKLIEQAFEVYNLQAVALVINSPGGSPAQSALIASHIRRLSEEKDIPVFAFVEDIAASGGYWLACAADEIYALDSSIVGSIGVISASFGFQELIRKHGVERRVHTAGKDKSFMDPFTEEKPSDVKRLKAVQKDLHEQFINWVNSRRAGKLEGADKDLFEGQFWTGRAALPLGIIDGIDSLRPFMQERYGEEIKFAEFGAEKKLLAGLLGTDVSLADEIVQAMEHYAIKKRYGA